jgi:2-dehydro-3-deoxygluconokinase
VCTVGDDALGRVLTDVWREAGLDLQSVRVDPEGPTGIYVNEHLQRGGHRFDYHRRLSAGSRLSLEDVSAPFLRGLDALYTSGITLAVSESANEAARAAASSARRDGALVAFGINYRPSLTSSAEDVLSCARNADIVFASADDLELLLGIVNLDAAVRALRGRAREVVVTAGEAGAAVDQGNGLNWISAPVVELVDAAGAGDALAGAYLASRLNRRTPSEALARGVAAAALSCQGFGAALSFPDPHEVERLAEQVAGRQNG